MTGVPQTAAEAADAETAAATALAGEADEPRVTRAPERNHAPRIHGRLANSPVVRRSLPHALAAGRYALAMSWRWFLRSSIVTATTIALLGSSANAQAPAGGSAAERSRQSKRERPRPFGQGVINFGGAAAFGSRPDGGVAFTFGANVGCFVLPGVEPGTSVEFTVGSGSVQTQLTALGYLRWILYRSYGFSPYLKAAGGGLFVFGESERLSLGLWGGGGGLVIGLGGRLALNLEALVLRASPSSDCPAGECTIMRFGFSLSLFFGGGRPRPRHPPRDLPSAGRPPTSPAPTLGPNDASTLPTPSSPSSTPGEAPTPTPDEPGLS